DRARTADIVGHEDVGADPDVLSRLDRRLAGGAREDLLRHRHRAHGPTSACWRWARYCRRYSSLLSAFTYASALAWMMSVWLPCPVTVWPSSRRRHVTSPWASVPPVIALTA